MKIKTTYQDFLNENNKISAGDFVKNNTQMIIDVFDPEDDGYVEYVSYDIDNKEFYFLDPDLNTLGGPFSNIKDLQSEFGIEEINLDNLPNSGV